MWAPGRWQPQRLSHACRGGRVGPVPSDPRPLGVSALPSRGLQTRVRSNSARPSGTRFCAVRCPSRGPGPWSLPAPPPRLLRLHARSFHRLSAALPGHFPPTLPPFGQRSHLAPREVAPGESSSSVHGQAGRSPEAERPTVSPLWKHSELVSALTQLPGPEQALSGHYRPPASPCIPGPFQEGAKPQMRIHGLTWLHPCHTLSEPAPRLLTHNTRERITCVVQSCSVCCDLLSSSGE